MSDLNHKPAEDDGGLEPPSDDILAGEYVLGVLDAEQRRALQARIEAEAAFAQRVSGWEQRMGELAASVEPVQVPAYLWPRIRERLGWSSGERSRGGLWRSIGFWRSVAAVAATAAIVAIVLVRIPGMLTPPQNRQAALPGATPVTTLAHDDGTPGWLAAVDAARGTVLLVPVPSPPDSRGRVPELWLIAPGQPARPLGLLSSDRAYTVAVPPGLRAGLTGGALLAVSLEPPGGAPNGAPTGPVVAKGMIQL